MTADIFAKIAACYLTHVFLTHMSESDSLIIEYTLQLSQSDIYFIYDNSKNDVSYICGK